MRGRRDLLLLDAEDPRFVPGHDRDHIEDLAVLRCRCQDGRDVEDVIHLDRSKGHVKARWSRAQSDETVTGGLLKTDVLIRATEKGS